MPHKNLIPSGLTARMVRSYIDFDGHTAERASTPSVQAELQSEGVAGLWALLREKGFAYLADEVGMGKTRQAMGVIATQFLSKADSRIVIVCSSATLQRQWQSEWSQFLRICYALLDDRLLGTADAAQLEELQMHHNLRDFARALKDGETRIHLLRYSSFSRPLSLDAESPERMLEDYAHYVGVSDVQALDGSELRIGAQFASEPEDWADNMGHALAAAYCRRIGVMLTDGSKTATGVPEPLAPLDLVVLDEAQYLRHTGNYQNKHLALIFRRNVAKWLFLSATPLHSSANDIRSLDTYLCHQAPATAAQGISSQAPNPEDCGSCKQAARCTRAAWRLDARTQPKSDVVDLLKDMMIRRTRTYADRDGARYGKIEYRQYDRVRHSGVDDPFLAMTMALVQKRLVGALAGRQNKFRQGECASFESLSSSVGRVIGPSRDKVAQADSVPDFEPAGDRNQNDEPGIALDRNVIDQLNHSFIDAMPLASGQGLPHAKLHRTAEELFERSLLDGSTEKTLVFVRRIDTVEEIRDLLHVKFQRDVDERIAAWHTLLSDQRMDGGSTPWQGNFWAHGIHAGGEDDKDDPAELPAEPADQDDDAPHAGAATHNRAFREQVRLPYFDALKERSGSRERNGKLVSFRNRLRSTREISHQPLRGFLLRQSEHGISAAVADDAHWQQNRARWKRFLRAVRGPGVEAALPDEGWLLGDPNGETSDAFKLAALQLCLLQAMRQTDFLVDLYILNTCVTRTPDGEVELPDKMLWLLEQDSAALPPKLARYIDNQRKKFRHWIEHFELIVDKCFRGGNAADWATIYRERITQAFRLMAPVIGRSGRIANVHAVSQFKFPTHPNILICTDVLKEGVDMHLFCDRVVHYGVAWTSGDLEQRIGRIDRLGSLISRRIGQHGVPAPERRPRLGVVFPYLDGTLDKYQVNRVIKAKIASDLRMDLGKRKDEIGEINVSALDADEAVRGERRAAGPKDGVVFFPESVAFVRSGSGDIRLPAGIVRKGADVSVRPRDPIDDRNAETLLLLPAYGAVLVRRQIDARHNVLRLSREPGKNPRLLRTEEFMMAKGMTPNATLAGALADSGPQAVREVPAPDFVFDRAHNTCVWQGGPELAGGGSGEPHAKVLLESIGEQFWMLRTFIRPGRAGEADAKRGIEQWLAERNERRTFGYLMEDEGAVWFSVVMQRSLGRELRVLQQAAARANRISMHLRQPGVRAGATTYRARTAFPSFGRNLFWMKNMKETDVVSCGQVLIGVQAWFSEAFESVMTALYDDLDPSQRSLVTQPLTFLPNGVLHLSAQGGERFCLQAFLDLNGAVEAGKPFAGPKMWWEIAASPHSTGARPQLPMSDIDEMPHASMHLWEGDVRTDCGAFTSTDAKAYRYVAFYHTPAHWDSSRAALLQSWSAVRAKMRELSNFQRKSCRDQLLGALEG